MRAKQQPQPARHRERVRAVPRRSTLEGFHREAVANGGIDLHRLEPLSRLFVKTLNTVYRLTVLDPNAAKVEICGGRFFAQPRAATLCGSSFGGSLLKLRWIARGMCMEIASGGPYVVTSPVQSVQVEEEVALPGPF